MASTCSSVCDNVNEKQCIAIPKVADMTVDEFHINYLKAEKPVVFEGYAKSWPAIGWTLERLKERAGQNTVYVRRKTDIEDYKVGQKYDIETMKFEQYVDNIIKCNKKSKGSYLAVQNIRKAFPQLSEDIIIPPYVRKLHAGPFLWIARGGHYEFCHFDPDDNFLVVLSGKKRVKLYGSDLKLMYPNQLGSKGRTIQSQVFCENPDYDKFPYFKEAVCYEVSTSTTVIFDKVSK